METLLLHFANQVRKRNITGKFWAIYSIKMLSVYKHMLKYPCMKKLLYLYKDLLRISGDLHKSEFIRLLECFISFSNDSYEGFLTCMREFYDILVKSVSVSKY
jgi:hypothetical protein